MPYHPLKSSFFFIYEAVLNIGFRGLLASQLPNLGREASIFDSIVIGALFSSREAEALARIFQRKAPAQADRRGKNKSKRLQVLHLLRF